jgi:hypothetical protein
MTIGGLPLIDRVRLKIRVGPGLQPVSTNYLFYSKVACKGHT